MFRNGRNGAAVLEYPVNANDRGAKGGHMEDWLGL
jgi:hypothetical protein